MMSQVIRQETTVFFLAVFHGIGLIFVYDLLRAFRRVFRHGNAAVSVEDFLFWILAAFLTFCFAFLKTDGIIRGYAAVGILLGAVLYHVSVSRYIVSGVCVFFRGIRMLVRGIRKILSKPVEKIWRKWKKAVVFAGKKAYNEKNRREETADFSAETKRRKRCIRKKTKGVSQYGK